ncbi:WD repeat-containing protein [Entamoeba marina]
MEDVLSKYVLGRINSQSFQSNYISMAPKFNVKNEQFCHTDTITSLFFNNDGTSFLSTSLDGYVMEWDTESFDFTNAYYVGHDGVLYGASNEDNLLCVVCSDGGVNLIDKRGMETIFIETPCKRACKCCFTPKELVIGYTDGTIKFWNIGSQKWGDTIDQHKQQITSLSYHKKGEVMSSSLDGNASVWDIKRKEIKYTFHSDKPIGNCKYVPNGKMLLLSTINGDAFFYKLENNSKSQHFQGFSHSKSIIPFDFLTDTREGQGLKKFIVGGSPSNCINLWSVESMKCVQTIQSLDGPVTALSCHPTEMMFITGGNLTDTSIKLWC